MLNDRQNKILKLLGQNDQTSVKELTSQLKVSSVTIRQDLNLLEQEGLLRRVHGGAALKDADDITNRLGINYEKKLRIAKKLASYINDGETILIESGSANALLARELLNRNVTIITTNVYIARQFRRHHQVKLILLGGLYQHESESMVGRITKVCIDQLNFNKAFLGIDGYNTGNGFTLRDLLRAEISSYIIRKSKEVFIVSDSGKFGKTELTSICQTCDIHHVATDTDLDQKYIDEFTKAGIDLILA
jgi:DeoR/GlpR family transcriptional regulator of sugar metabolism